MSQEFEGVSQETEKIMEILRIENENFLDELMLGLEQLNENMTVGASLMEEAAYILQVESDKYNCQKQAMEEELIQLNTIVHRSNVMLEIKNREKTAGGKTLKRDKKDFRF